MKLPPSADTAHHVVVIRIEDSDDSHRWTTIPGETIATLDGDRATELLDLVAKLPNGQLARCFIPGYGIRVHGADEPLFEIAFCFQCDGALVLQPGNSALVGFKAKSRTARALLAQFQALK